MQKRTEIYLKLFWYKGFCLISYRISFRFQLAGKMHHKKLLIEDNAEVCRSLFSKFFANTRPNTGTKSILLASATVFKLACVDIQRPTRLQPGLFYRKHFLGNSLQSDSDAMPIFFSVEWVTFRKKSFL